MEQGTTEFFSEYGYYKDMEPRLTELADGRSSSLSGFAASQIKHLKESLRQMVSIVEIHSQATQNNFAWAELAEARLALGDQHDH